MTYHHLRLSSHEPYEPHEPRTALPALILCSALSLMLWSLLGRIVSTLAA